MKPKMLFVVANLLSVLASHPVDAQGITFSRTYGGPKYDCGHAVQQVPDGGFILVGTTYTLTPSGDDLYAVRTNPTGDTLWTRAIGGPGNDRGWSVCQTSDGGFVIAGTSTALFTDPSSILLIKLDSAGTTAWTRTVSRSRTDCGYSICETADSGLAVAGVLGPGPHGGTDACLLKTNRLGDTLWTKTFGGTQDDGARCIQRLPDGGFILAGYSNSVGAVSSDHYVIRTDAQGDALWTRTYGGPDHQITWSVDRTIDSCFIVAGSATQDSLAQTSMFVLMKLNGNGDTLWTKTIAGASLESSASVKQTSDGGFVLVGTTGTAGQDEDVFIAKTDHHGEILWTRSHGGGFTDCGWSVQECSDHGFVVAGMVHENSFDACLLKTNESGLIVGIQDEQLPTIPTSVQLFQNYPNPFNASSTIRFALPRTDIVTLKVYDILGRDIATLVDNAEMPPGIHDFHFDGAQLTSGMYFYRLQTSTMSKTEKLILLK